MSAPPLSDRVLECLRQLPYPPHALQIRFWLEARGFIRPNKYRRVAGALSHLQTQGKIWRDPARRWYLN